LTKKTLFLLNVDNYAPALTQITYPFIYTWANKIGAEVVQITERKFPEWPITYEKLQIYELARKHGAEWNIYIDSDALVHPETPDWTAFIPRDTVAHNGADFAGVRWSYDHYFLRDGRNVGSCNWLSIASDWCLDLWRPLDDLSPEEALSRIHPTMDEVRSGVVDTPHLVDDYALSRNIARFGLKVQTLHTIQKRLGFNDPNFFFHVYTSPVEDYQDGTKGEDGELVTKPGKITQMHQTLARWGMAVKEVVPPRGT
jgi:hypothetical protein